MTSLRHGWGGLTDRPVPGALLAVAAIANLLPVLCFEVLPTRDGPAHMYSAWLIRELLFNPDGVAAQFVQWNPAPVPNWSGHVLMAAAMSGVGPVTAERLMIAAIVLTLPLSMRYAIGAVTPRFTGLEFIALPLGWGLHLRWGFFNFCLSLSVYMLALGFFLRRHNAPTAGALTVWAILCVVTYFSSLIAFCHLLMTTTIWLLTATDAGARRRVIGRWLMAMLPAAALWALFLLIRPSLERPGLEFPSWLWAAAQIGRLDILSWGVDDRGVTLLAALGFWMTVTVVLWRRMRHGSLQVASGLLASAVAGLAVLFFAPTSAGGATLLTPRHACFVVIALVIYLAADPQRLPGPWIVVAAAVLTAVGLHASRWDWFEGYERAVQQLRAGALLPERAVLVSQALPDGHPTRVGGSGGTGVGESVPAYVAVDQGAFWASLYELRTDHFPLTARSISRDGEIAWAGGPFPVDAALLWAAEGRSTVLETGCRLVAAGDASGKSTSCAVDIEGVDPTTAILFLADCRSGARRLRYASVAPCARP